jgi:transcriptional regulator with XRE-family HTH domain
VSDTLEKEISERLKNAILSNGGYEIISQKTGISLSTLKRTASGKTEPKFSTVALIAKETGKNLSFIAYGTGPEDATVTIDGENRLKAQIGELQHHIEVQSSQLDTLKARLDKLEQAEKSK